MATAPPEKPEDDQSAPSVYLQDAADLQRVFNQFDANGDGKISVDELGDVFKSLGTFYTAEELRRVIDDMDADHDGFIDMEDFGRLCRSSSSSASAELRDAFDLYDQNGDGLISAGELHQVLLRLGMKSSVEDCARMIAGVDADGDGSVNFVEFEKMMTATAGAAKNSGS